MIRLHNLKPRPGAKHRVKRLGSGESSGHGKTSGKGHKGQKARSGGSIRLGFEGGQMPLIRRLPKRGFNNAAFKRRIAVINLDDLSDFNAGTVVNEKMLRESNYIHGRFEGLKILGRGELKHGLMIEADGVSQSAREKIEKVGGTVTLRERKTRTGMRVETEAQSEPDEVKLLKEPSAKKATKSKKVAATKKTKRKASTSK
jgi:large subunit ribosomal protein L15